MKFFLSLLFCFQLSAATLYVATTGDDSRSYATAQNVSTPWRTLTNAAAKVVAGDTVYVAAGTYTNQFNMTTAGNAANRITWYGAANNASIIDRSVAWTTGWNLATGPGIEAAVYTNKTMPYEPGLLKADGKTVVNIRTEADKFIVYAWNDAKTTDGGEQYPGTWNWWDGIGAAWMYQTNTGTVWIHFVGGAHPNTKNIRISPADPRVKNDGSNDLIDMLRYEQASAIKMASYNTLSGFNVRGSAWGIFVPIGCAHSIIESNLVEDGFHQLHLGDNQANSSTVSNNIVRYNTITPNYYGFEGGAWNRYKGTLGWKRYRPYRYTKSYISEGWAVEAAAVYLTNIGNSNSVHNNIFTNCSAGAGFSGVYAVSYGGPGVGNVMSSNQFYHTSGQSIWVGPSLDHTHIAFNESEDSKFFVRMQYFNNPRNYQSRVYYYGNKGWNPQGWGTAAYLHIDTSVDAAHTWKYQTEMWLYHNSFEGVESTIALPSDPLKTNPVQWYYRTNYPFGKVYVVNNILNSLTATTFEITTALTNGLTSFGGFDYNRIRGMNSLASYQIGILGTHNITNLNFEWGTGTTLGTTVPDFMLVAGSPSISKGIPISSTFSFMGSSKSALPGFTGTYYSGTSPDLGANQYDYEEPGTITNVLSFRISDPLIQNVLSDSDSGADAIIMVERSDVLVDGELVDNTFDDCAYTVEVSSPDGAVENVDYSISTKNGTINDGSVYDLISLQTKRNSAYTGQRTVTVTIQPSDNYEISGGAFDIILLDADLPPEVFVRPQPQPGHGIID